MHAAATVEPVAGISRQMQWEQQAAQELGLQWRTCLFTLGTSASNAGSGVVVRIGPVWMQRLPRSLRWLILRIRFYGWLSVQRSDYDRLLLRYSVHDPFQLLYVLVFGRSTYLVHHSKELEELRSLGGCGGMLRSWVERVVGRLTITLSAGIVAATDEILAYEAARDFRRPRFTATYPNGVLFDDSTASDERGEPPVLLFVASSFLPWHGLDLLLEAAHGSRATFEVHLVGHIPDSLVAEVQSDDRFVIHGRLSVAEIKILASRAWLGIGALALDRIELHQACSLKVREYLLWGLPVVAGHQDVFPGSFRYFQHVDPDVDEMLAIAHDLRNITREQVRLESEPFISKVAAVRSLWENLRATWAGADSGEGGSRIETASGVDRGKERI